MCEEKWEGEKVRKPLKGLLLPRLPRKSHFSGVGEVQLSPPFQEPFLSHLSGSPPVINIEIYPQYGVLYS
jgi:hypothetical protein